MIGYIYHHDPGELIVCLMGDPQLIMVPETPVNVRMAMDDLAEVNHDFMAVLGDLAQNRAGLIDRFAIRKKIWFTVRL